jgi:tyrosinase
VRIFLVAQQVAENRRMWIEMDKFHYTLQPSQQAVIFRSAALSSVIRKPAVKPPGVVQQPVPSPDTPDPNAPENYCDCGWPYNLLLPRGTSAGMGFRFMVMLTDWTKDQVADDTTCGSMSFCGAKDRYPDSRFMGYPFDRPFGNSSIAQTITAQNNMATRDITIRLVSS